MARAAPPAPETSRPGAPTATSTVSCPFAMPTSGAATRARPQSPARCQADTSARRTCSRPAGPALVRHDHVQHEAGGQRAGAGHDRGAGLERGGGAPLVREALAAELVQPSRGGTDRRERRVGRPEHGVHRFPRRARRRRPGSPAGELPGALVHVAGLVGPAEPVEHSSQQMVSLRIARVELEGPLERGLRAGQVARLIEGVAEGGADARALGLELERPPEADRGFAGEPLPPEQPAELEMRGRVRRDRAGGRAGGRRPPPRTAGGG